MSLTTAQRRLHYGAPGKVKRSDVTDHIPYTAVSSRGRKAKMFVHHMLADEFVDACLEAHARSAWIPKRMDCYNPRPVRGGSKWSTHAWAMAIDFFTSPYDVYPPGGVWTPDDAFLTGHRSDARLDPEFARFVEAFTDRGWTWGGQFRRKTRPKGQTRGPAGMDTPHFEWSKPPRFLGMPLSAQAPGRYLKAGDRGKQVQTLQTELAALAVSHSKWFHPPGPADGIFGPSTEAAVKAFQKTRGLKVDGQWGDRSATALLEVKQLLEEAETSPNPGAEPPATGDNQTVLAALQTVTTFIERVTSDAQSDS